MSADGPGSLAGIDPRPLLEALDEPACVIDAAGVRRCDNQRFARLAGELAGPLRTLFSGARELASLPELDALLRGEIDRVEIEIPADWPSPGYRLVATPCAVDGGRGALVRLAEARGAGGGAVDHARRFLDTIIESIPLPMFVKDAKEHRYLRVNKSFELFYGASREEMVGKNSYDLLPKEQADKVAALDNEVIERGEPTDSPEVTVFSRTLGVRIIHLWKMPMYDPEGGNRYLLGMFDDITERLKLEESRRHELTLLATQSRLREVIRELSTPIIPIHPGILVVPLVGQMDSDRSAQFIDALLAGIERHRADVVLLDITGVTVVDAPVANHLLQATRAAGLLGARSVLVGASPDVARTVTELGIDLGGLRTQRNLEAGFRYALAERGYAVVSRGSSTERHG